MTNYTRNFMKLISFNFTLYEVQIFRDKVFQYNSNIIYFVDTFNGPNSYQHESSNIKHPGAF